MSIQILKANIVKSDEKSKAIWLQCVLNGAWQQKFSLSSFDVMIKFLKFFWELRSEKKKLLWHSAQFLPFEQRE